VVLKKKGMGCSSNILGRPWVVDSMMEYHTPVGKQELLSQGERNPKSSNVKFRNLETNYHGSKIGTQFSIPCFVTTTMVFLDVEPSVTDTTVPLFLGLLDHMGVSKSGGIP